ncbi:MAG: RNA pseudouridine synthase [Candidatus Zambryskibacteria bacterium CG10_big_fil_rev_8_21_14_0_10_42_12]|uniref:Pseudouridine synthase n=1 Tax=Candidatus Zambryskibacteria bacterium CG10_big_fil_rev_8_21_14_0_10_42_12 TaxID=1975115 RepID=A0A2H0QWW6_9BACT|nr:MAG: RNA pseudouridine synthase [Candidatus Zambryskibacteria bacterium CG10_big_fil_rev_8_21_14_0_10_42_12]
MNISVLYEDDDVLVLDKPAGLLVHGDGRSVEETLVDWIHEQYPDIQDVGEDARVATGEIVKRPGIVHRIDRDTSGVIIVCKTAESFAHMKRQFQTRQVEKHYKAFVYDNIKEDEGVIDKPIGRSPKDFRQWSSENNARGELREAETRWKKIISTKTCAFLEVIPKTGRTHQIRVHLKYIEHPIVADPLYAPQRAKLLGFERLALHAHQISFETVSGKKVSVEAPYPRDFEKAIETIAKEETL